MDTTKFNAALVAVPVDDGSIGHALDELDTRIAAWVSAVAATQSAIAGLAEFEARSAELAAARAVAASAAQVHAAAGETQPATSVVEATAVAAPATTPAEPPIESAAARGVKKPAGMRLGHLTEKKPAAPAVKRGIRVYEEDAPEPERIATTTDDDEALLAQLDPQMARQIRIKRRLCNNTKSVRQLLDEEQKDKKKGKK